MLDSVLRQKIWGSEVPKEYWSVEGNGKAGVEGDLRPERCQNGEVRLAKEAFPQAILGKSLPLSMFWESTPQCLPLIDTYSWDFEDPKQGKPEDTEEV